MRKFKFRVWGMLHSNKPQMFIPSLGEFNDIDDEISNLQNDGYIFMQYTGLKDSSKEKIEIYEGDIVDIYDENHKEVTGRGYVFYREKDACFMHTFIEIFDGKLDSCSRPSKSFFENLKVIGNIYENKDLLNEQA